MSGSAAADRPITGAAPRTVLGNRQAEFLTCVAERIVPELAGASRPVRERLLAAIDGELRTRSRLQQLEFKLLLAALRWIPLLFALRPFEHITSAQQDDLLRRLQDAPLTLLRVGIWGLKTLVFLGYYSQDVVTDGIYYSPSKAEGNYILHQLRQHSGDLRHAGTL
ncbi:MAG: hypothetical protein JOY71_31460 [Acetobacteraceae bacterium]|nr:hypothetical protein [Acetobacteraceae bacterium]